VRRCCPHGRTTCSSVLCDPSPVTQAHDGAGCNADFLKSVPFIKTVEPVVLVSTSQRLQPVRNGEDIPSGVSRIRVRREAWKQRRTLLRRPCVSCVRVVGVCGGGGYVCVLCPVCLCCVRM